MNATWEWPDAPDATETVEVGGALIHLERFGAASGGRGPVFLFLHGIAAYAAPYRSMAAAAARAGAGTVYLPDLRGHGRSTGKRGDLVSADVLLADVVAVLAHVRASHPEAELVLGGESMGGLIALAVAASRRVPVDRLLLLAPALRLHAGNMCRAALPSLRRLVAERRGIPAQAAMPGEPLRHAEFHAACEADPLMLRTVSARYVATIARLQLGWARRYPSRIPMPCLVVQGDADALLDSRAAAKLVELLPDGELRAVAGAWHNLLWDPTSQSTMKLIADWIRDDETTVRRGSQSA